MVSVDQKRADEELVRVTAPLGAEGMLQLWGLRISGGALRSVGLRPGVGGEPGIDEALVVVRYVESTAGFELAQDPLKWVYVRGRRVEEFPISVPGQSLAAGLFSRGWGMYLGADRRLIAGSVVREFVMELERRIRREPLTTGRICV